MVEKDKNLNQKQSRKENTKLRLNEVRKGKDEGIILDLPGITQGIVW